MDELKHLSGMLRVGTVMDVDVKARRARVKYADADGISGWLYLLDMTPEIPGGKTGETSGGGEDEAFASHSHTVTLSPWAPKVNDRVLCIFMPVFCGDGFVLGRIG